MPLLCFQGNFWENAKISYVINFEDLKLNDVNFLSLLIKPIYSFFQVDGLPICWGIYVEENVLVVSLNSIVYLFAKETKNKQQHGTELHAVEWSNRRRPSKTEMGPLRIHLTHF